MRAVVQRAGTFHINTVNGLVSFGGGGLFVRYVGKWDREGCLLDMPDVSSGASPLAPGYTTKRGREVHCITILSPLPQHTNLLLLSIFPYKYLGEKTLFQSVKRGFSGQCQSESVCKYVNIHNYFCLFKEEMFVGYLILKCMQQSGIIMQQ